MVDAEAVEDGGVEVAHVHRVLDGIVGELVGFTVGNATLDARPSHPDAEVTWVVVAAVVGLGERALRIDGAAEFAAPDDQGVVEHAATLEVLNERPRGLVDVLALRLDVVREIAVLVPAAVEDLDEAHTPFD